MTPNPPTPTSPERTRFKVRLERTGVLHIECHHGTAMSETGPRGLPSLVNAGLLRRPSEFHVEPVTGHLHIDGSRFECTAEGAARLEAVLNEHYATEIASRSARIHVKDNAGSPTGFDIQYATDRHGVHHEVTAHLTQEALDQLQDPGRAEFIRPGVVLRLMPPYLHARQRHHDGHETPIPDVPDLDYRHATIRDVQSLLNHPAIARHPGSVPVSAVADAKPVFTRLEIVRRPDDHAHLWLECHTPGGTEPTARALTHQNLSDLQKAGAFLASHHLSLALDNTTLRILNLETNAAETFMLRQDATDEVLGAASRHLTALLHPAPAPAPTAAASTPAPPATPPPATPPPATPPPAPIKPVNIQFRPVSPQPAPTGPRNLPRPVPPPPMPPAKPPAPTVTPLPRELEERFAASRPGENQRSLFETLAADLGMGIEDLHLSLPRVFQDRHFRVLNFSGTPVESVLDLRAEGFFGFYLVDLASGTTDLVYACQGLHLEWGANRCTLLPSIHSETLEFHGPALLGLAQDPEHHFVFLVTPEYRKWAGPFETAALHACARWMTLAEYGAVHATWPLVWPMPPAST